MHTETELEQKCQLMNFITSRFEHTLRPETAGQLDALNESSILNALKKKNGHRKESRGV